MKRTGFRALNLALVTSDKQQQRATKRPGSTSHFDRVVNKAAEADLEMVNYVILGLPDSTLEEMLDSVIHLMQRPVLIGPSVFYATPGTESYRQCLERDLLSSAELALQRSTCFPVETKNFSRRDLVTLFRITRFLNFIKSRLDAQPTCAGEIALAELLASPNLPDFTPQAGELYTFSHKLTEAEIGCWLARALLNEGRLLGMRLVRREKEKVIYRDYEEEASPRVVKLFLEMMEGKTVHGVKNHFVFTKLLRDLDFESQLTENQSTRSDYVRSNFHLREATCS
jgi:hypothetical protein